MARLKTWRSWLTRQLYCPPLTTSSCMETAVAKIFLQHITCMSTMKPSKEPKNESWLSMRHGTTILCGLRRLHRVKKKRVQIPFPGTTASISCKISTPRGRWLNGSRRYFGTRLMRLTVVIRMWLPRSCLILTITQRHCWVLSISWLAEVACIFCQSIFRFWVLGSDLRAIIEYRSLSLHC